MLSLEQQGDMFHYDVIHEEVYIYIIHVLPYCVL